MKTWQLLAILFPAAVMNGTVTAQQPQQRPDDSRITLYGRVDSIGDGSFLLDHGGGRITVETGDILNDDQFNLAKGDEVTVFGTIDQDFQEQRTIAAGSMYVERFGSLFHAGAMDETGYFYHPRGLDERTDAVIQGSVKNVRREGFTLDTGERELLVSVSGMAYNPLEGRGEHAIDQGDVVNVTGNLENEFFQDKPVFDADTVVTVRATGR